MQLPLKELNLSPINFRIDKNIEGAEKTNEPSPIYFKKDNLRKRCMITKDLAGVNYGVQN